MNRTLAARLDRVARARADRETPPPGLVLMKVADGFMVDGRTFPTVADAQAAHPGHTLATVILEVMNCRRQEVPLDAA